MSNMIKMSHEELRTIAKKYIEASDNIETTLNSLKSAQTELASVWEGDAFTAFEEQFTALAPKVEQFAVLMQDINRQLVEVSNAVADTDAQLGKIVRKNTGSF